MKQLEAMNWNENLGWCKPHTIRIKDGRRLTWTEHEGKVEGIRLMGKNLDWDFEAGPQQVQGDWRTEVIELLEELTGEEAQELGCPQCPWREECEAMQLEIEG